MDGPRPRTGVGALRPALPIWERTPRAVPPPLGPPPPIEAERQARARIGVPIGAGARAGERQPHQGPRMLVAAQPRTPWGVEPVGRANSRTPVAGLPARPIRPVPAKGLPWGIAAGMVAVVAVAAVAAAAVLMRSGTPAGPGGKQPIQPAQGQRQYTSPLDQALTDLSGEPMLRYSGVSPDGHSAWQLTVTTGGEALGDIDLGDGKLGVLEAGGRTYFKAADTASVGLLGELPSGVTATSVRGKWVTGDSALEALLPSGLVSAGNLAASLRSSLSSQDTGLPSPTTSATRVDGIPAVPVTTSAGLLYISTAQPYRVLRLVPTPASATEPGRHADVETVSQTSAINFFNTLIEQTKTLTGALDFGIVFDYSQGPKLYCSDNSCTVEVDTVVASAADRAAVPVGAVVADVTATVTADGQPAGGCEVLAKMPLDQQENLSCQDRDAASVVLKGGGDLALDVGIRFAARSVTQADVDQMVTGEQNEQGAANGSRSPAPGGYVG